MKKIKRILNLILLSIIVAVPFTNARAAEKLVVPIYVNWLYEGKPWALSPHRANVVIKAENGAPEPKKTSFDHAGNYIVHFTEPSFTDTGKYEYLIYQANEDFSENGRTVTYDKTRYRLIFYVQSGENGLVTTTYAYDDSKYLSTRPKDSKVAKIVFNNDDPHVHRHDETIIDPENPHHPFNPTNPDGPDFPNNPTDPTNPHNPPLNPKDPDRDETNTPIYPTDPENEDEDKVINPDPWNKPNPPVTPPINPPGPNPGEEDTTVPFPWWPWPWNPVNPKLPVDPVDPTRPVDPSNPTDPTRPTDPTNPPVPTDPDDEKYPQRPTEGDKDTPDKPGQNEEDPKEPISDDDNVGPIKPNPEENPSENPDDTSNEEEPTNEDDKVGPIDKPPISTETDKVDQPKDDQVGLIGKDKDSNGNVKTGIESVGIWLIILVAATGAYYISKKSDKKYI